MSILVRGLKAPDSTLMHFWLWIVRAFRFFHSKGTLACILHRIKDGCDQGFSGKKKKKKAIQCCDWLIDSMKITTDTQKPAMISHDLAMLPSVTILTVRVTNVHLG